jgi:hypothetical protein
MLDPILPSFVGAEFEREKAAFVAMVPAQCPALTSSIARPSRRAGR